MMTDFGIRGETAVRVLEVDRDLGEQVPCAEMGWAGARSVARVLTVEGRSWVPAGSCLAAGPSWLGLLVLDGLLLRRVCVGSHSACEVLAPGDVFRPWDEDRSPGPIPVIVDWRVLRPSWLAVLDGEFARRMAPWPSVYVGLMQRIVARSRRLAIGQAVTRRTSTAGRLLLLLWLLADRFGVMTGEGVVIRLPVTHELLGTLVGCRRPTVTTTLSKMSEQGLVRREARDRWLLSNAALTILRESDRLDETDNEETHDDADEPVEGAPVLNAVRRVRAPAHARAQTTRPRTAIAG